ncbi:MAG: hypothetical protein AB7I32_01330 [Gammaproteobacteria bacterium]
MPKNAVLALLVVLVIAFAYWLGRHAAERATTTVEVAPAPPVAAPAPAPKPPPPPARKGMSWGVAADVETPEGIVLVSCHGEPTTDTGSCDAHQGDTVCTKALPLLCLKTDDTPAPAGLRASGVDGALPDDLRAGWAGGTVATTAPMPGTALKTRDIADRACAAAFGDTWRLAEFHAGGRDGRPLDGAVTAPGSAQSRPVHATGGGAFYAAGDPIRTSRFWVAIDDRPANCWD